MQDKTSSFNSINKNNSHNYLSHNNYFKYHKKNIHTNNFQPAGDCSLLDNRENSTILHGGISPVNLMSVDSPMSNRNLFPKSKGIILNTEEHKVNKSESQTKLLEIDKQKSECASPNEPLKSSTEFKDTGTNIKSHLRNHNNPVASNNLQVQVPAAGKNNLSFLALMKNMVQANNSSTIRGPRKSGFFQLMDLLALRKKDDNFDYPISRMQLEMIHDKSMDLGRKYNNLKREISSRKSNIFANLEQIKSKTKSKGLIHRIKHYLHNRRKKKAKKQIHHKVEKSLSKRWEEFKLYVKKFKMPPLIIKPESTVHIFWDILCMILINYQLLIVPFQLSFDYDEPKSLKIFELICDLFFMLDIILTINTAYYGDNGLVMDRKKIFVNYLKCWFWIDLIASFPYSWLDGEIIDDRNNISTSMNTKSSVLASVELVKLIRFLRFLKIFRLLRFLKLTKIFNKFESLARISMTISGLIGFIKLTIFILYLSHWLGCAWHYLGINQMSESTNTWLTIYGIANESWNIRYLASVYWAVTTMVTIGYGDIKPITNSEKALAIFAMIMSCCVFAFVINRMNVLIEQIEYTAFLYRSKMRSFTNQLRNKGVNANLISKIKRYMEYYFAEQKSFSSEETKLLGLLSDSLKDELITQIYAQIISQIPFLIENFSTGFLATLAYIVKELNCGPNEEIWTETVDDHSLYYIYAGEVVICINGIGTEVKILTQGLHFGEIAFFTGLTRTAFAKSREYCRLFKISRIEFLALIERYPKDREKFYMIKDRILLYDSYDDLKMDCYACKMPNHLITNCPLFHFKKDKPFMLKKYLAIEEVFSKSYIRRNRKRIYLYKELSHDIQNIHKNLHEELTNLEKLITDYANDPLGTNKLLESKLDSKDPNYKPYRAKLAAIIMRRFNLKLNKNQAKNEETRTRSDLDDDEKDIKIKRMPIECDIDIVANFGVYFPYNNSLFILSNYINPETNELTRGLSPRLTKESMTLKKAEQQYEMLLCDFNEKCNELKSSNSKVGISESSSSVEINQIPKKRKTKTLLNNRNDITSQSIDSESHLELGKSDHNQISTLNDKKDQQPRHYTSLAKNPNKAYVVHKLEKEENLDEEKEKLTGKIIPKDNNKSAMDDLSIANNSLSPILLPIDNNKKTPTHEHNLGSSFNNESINHDIINGVNPKYSPNKANHKDIKKNHELIMQKIIQKHGTDQVLAILQKQNNKG